MQNQKQELIQTALTVSEFLNYLSTSDAIKTHHDSMTAKKLSMQLNRAAEARPFSDDSCFAFELGQSVSLIGNFDEQGQVIARAQYTNGCNQYWIRYRNGNNVTVEVWWAEDALIATE